MPTTLNTPATNQPQPNMDPGMQPQSAIIDIHGLTKRVQTSTGPLAILDNINLSIRPGEYVMLYGRSGSGKTTLINMIMGIDRPTAGEVVVGGRNIAAMKNADLAHYRMAALGMVYQNSNIIDSLTALQNVELPVALAGVPEERRRPYAMKLMEMFHISNLATKMPSELSAGEKYRVALARALINNPLVLVADSMTDYLDTKTADDVMENIRFVNEQSNLTIVLATNNPDFVHYPHRVVYMADGKIARIVDNRPLRSR